MKTKLCIVTSLLALPKILSPSTTRASIVYTLALVIGISSNTAFAGRFDAPSLKLPLNQFDSRIDGDVFNVDFLIAHVIGTSRKTVREVGEIINGAQDVLQDTAVFTNTNNNSVNGAASAGSVVIPPGTTADTIIILNQNEGDSIAIQR